jgi:REP element-mobilizing transposase RayT
MRKRRKFYRGVVNHIYQRTIDGFQLFYTLEDCLVFFTIFSVCARSAEIQVLELCLMHNHTHILVKTETLQELVRFVDHFSAWFVQEYNSYVGRTGKLFSKSFGSAPKWDEKKLRSAIIYVGNNPVEKKFCKRALDCRWNFLAYRNNLYPFSDKLVKRNASYYMKQAFQEVNSMVRLNLPLKYAQLNRIFQKLTEAEREQLVDYIISSYSPINYEELESHFKSYDSMLLAMESTTGYDYDIQESRDDFSLKAFNEMMAYIKTKLPKSRVRTITTYTLEEKIALFKELQANTSASIHQICSFLHIKTEKA